MIVKGMRLPRSLNNIMIPDILINPMPQDKIAMRQFGVLMDFNHPERYWQRLDEIVYEVSEEMAILP